MRINWSDPGSRRFETGVDRGVLFVKNSDGVPWDGLVSVSDNPIGGEPRPYYLDGIKYMNIPGPEELEISLSAFQSPPEFDRCDGALEINDGLFARGQFREEFGLSYRTMIGNDTQGTKLGYKIHLVYNALATPSARVNSTLGDDFDLDPLVWRLTTRPVNFLGNKVSPHFFLDTTRASGFIVTWLEEQLYGNAQARPKLPTIEEIVGIEPGIYGEALFNVDIYGLRSYQ